MDKKILALMEQASDLLAATRVELTSFFNEDKPINSAAGRARGHLQKLRKDVIKGLRDEILKVYKARKGKKGGGGKAAKKAVGDPGRGTVKKSKK